MPCRRSIFLAFVCFGTGMACEQESDTSHGAEAALTAEDDRVGSEAESSSADSQAHGALPKISATCHYGGEVERFPQALGLDPSVNLLVGRLRLGDEFDYLSVNADLRCEARARTATVEPLESLVRAYDGAPVQFVVESTARLQWADNPRVFASAPCGPSGAKPNGWLSDRLEYFEGQEVGLLVRREAHKGVSWIVGVAPRVGDGLQAQTRVISFEEIINYKPPGPSPKPSDPDLPARDEGGPLPPSDFSGMPRL